MKRISMVLLAGFLLVPLAMAQITGFSQRGLATQELRADGLSIAHPSLPLNSRAMVVNTWTGREVEVTVVSRISASQNRIADFSAGLWHELGMRPDTEIRIYTSTPARPRVAANTAGEPVPGEQTPARYSTDPEIINRLTALEAWVAQYSADPEILQRIAALEAIEIPPSPDPVVMERLSLLEAREIPPGTDPVIMERLTALEAREIPPGSDPEIVERLSALEAREIPPGTDPVIMERLTALETREIPPSTDPVIIHRIAALEAWIAQYSSDPAVLERLAALEASETPAAYNQLVTERLAALEALVAQHGPDPVTAERLSNLEARREERETVVVQQPPSPVVLHVHPQLTQHVPVFGPMPQVVPRLPDPNSGRIYRLQVGAFSSQATAERIAREMSSIGFNVAMEGNGSLYRVFATDVPAAMVHPAVQRLGTIGINQVWVRE